MNAVLDNIYARRSVRKFTDEKVNDDIIKELIKAGFHAANGMNAQALRFAVVSDANVLNDYSDHGKELFMKVANNPHITEMLSKPGFNIFSNAPAVIFVFATDDAATPVEDASLALGNMMLAAKSMGLGTCWIGFAAALGMYDKFVNDTNSKGLKHLGTLTLGYPAKDSGPTPRGEPQIIGWIR